MSSVQTPPLLVWLRADLRLHDHPALHLALREAQKTNAKLLLIWCWSNEERVDGIDLPRVDQARTHFTLSCAHALQAEVERRGGRLILCQGRAERVIPQLVERLNISKVYGHHAVANDEREEERRLAGRLAELGAPLLLAWGHTLYEQRQLPFELNSLPDIFTQFRKKMEREPAPKAPLTRPERITTPPEGADSLLKELGIKEAPTPPHWEEDERACLRFEVGERGGLNRVEDYLWTRGCIETYKETRNGMVGESYSTKLSPWLSVGALSPRYVWHEVLRYERERVENDSTYWVRFELLWREYFQWVALKWGARLFQAGGLKSTSPLKREPLTLNSRARRAFEQWRSGETEDSFVNANMRELSATGFMSNRGRQNVASYLVHDLGVDWRAGAAYFESQLIDYDPASNWGNWAYVAGVGNDPRPQRRFNTQGQAARYDGDHRFRDHWR